jgi:hypothetical protein
MIRPAFDSTLQLGAFTAILLAALTLPITLSWVGAPSRRAVYEAATTGVGPFPFFKHQIFDEKSDIDLLFIGPSLLWVAIDDNYLEQTLSQRLGRPSKVLTLGTNWRGEDLYYTLLKDISSHRKIKTLVITMPTLSQLADEPHSHSFGWLGYGQSPELLGLLPFKSRLQIYAEELLGSPRHLLSLIRPNRPEPVDPNSPSEKHLGALLVRQGFRGEKFVESHLAPPVIPTEEMIQQTAPPGTFEFTGPPLGPYQLGVNQALLRLARERKIPVILLHVPLGSERDDTRVKERLNWPEFFGNPALPLVGIPPQRLFPGMKDEQILSYYYDDHLNLNGNQYFTRAVAPALLRIYEQNTRFTH